MQQYLIPSELSWLSFNNCILDEADDSHNALYERIKFLAIFSSNLDEFFRVKIRKLLVRDSKKNKELLEKILQEVNRQQNRFGIIWNGAILHNLQNNNIVYYENQEMHQEHVQEIEYYFKSIIFILHTGNLYNGRQASEILSKQPRAVFTGKIKRFKGRF